MLWGQPGRGWAVIAVRAVSSSGVQRWSALRRRVRRRARRASRPARENSRSRSRLGSQRRAGWVGNPSIWVQASTSQARATTAHQLGQGARGRRRQRDRFSSPPANPRPAANLTAGVEGG